MVKERVKKVDGVLRKSYGSVLWSINNQGVSESVGGRQS